MLGHIGHVGAYSDSRVYVGPIGAYLGILRHISVFKGILGCIWGWRGCDCCSWRSGACPNAACVCSPGRTVGDLDNCSLLQVHAFSGDLLGFPVVTVSHDFQFI